MQSACHQQLCEPSARKIRPKVNYIIFSLLSITYETEDNNSASLLTRNPKTGTLANSDEPDEMQHFIRLCTVC